MDSKIYQFPKSFIEVCRKAFVSTHKQFLKASRLEATDLDIEFTAWFGERWKLEGEADRDTYIVSKVGAHGYHMINRKEVQEFVLAEKAKIVTPERAPEEDSIEAFTEEALNEDSTEKE
jgi:hypothetical protein